MASDPPEGRTLRLRDGRFLGYAEYGDPAGKPLFFFHGFPGSRLEGRLGHEAAAAAGVRLVALDRPGFGLSDFKARRSIPDWPDDVLEAADALGIDVFAVIGVSGGGPYAAACAFKIPHRLTAAAIVSGTAPHTPATTESLGCSMRTLLSLVGGLPSLARPPLWWWARQVRRNPERFLSRMESALPEPDQAIFARPQVRAVFKADLTEAFRHRSRAAAQELVLYCRPWGFRLEDISMPVYLWQGGADRNVPPAMGRYLAAAIPNCRATFFPGEGHLLVVDRMQEIQSALFP